MAHGKSGRSSAPARRRLLATAVASVLVASLSVPTTRAAAEDEEAAPRVSGFLGDYSDLRPHPHRKHMLVFRKREGVLKPYRSFIVERPVIRFHPEAVGEEKADSEELEMLADHLRTAVVEALEKGGGYRVVEEAGPGVLRLRAAITDVVPVSPGKNVGPKAAGAVVGIGLLVPRVDLGGASIEVEMLDSETNERLVAVVASKKASRFGGLIKGAKRWGDVKAAFDKWARIFRKTLDRVHES